MPVCVGKPYSVMYLLEESLKKSCILQLQVHELNVECKVVRAMASIQHMFMCAAGQ